MNNDDRPASVYRDYNGNDSYYLNFNDSALIYDYGVTTTFLRGTCGILFRTGLILIQFGCVPSTNVNGVILQNVIDLSCGTVAYGAFGYMLSFGHDKGGLIGWGGMMFAKEANLDKAVLGWFSIIAISGIYTTMFAGRLHYIGCFLITSMMAAAIIPVVMHWIWTSSGLMHKVSFIQNLVSYKDHAGGMLIHVCGGTIGLIGSLFLGRRLLRLQDIDESSLTPESPASVTVGYLLVIIGLMAISLPTPAYELSHEPLNYTGLLFLNNILAATGGIFVVVLLQFLFSRRLLLQYWTVLRYLQAAVAGMITIASGVDVYSPHIALGLGIVGAILFYIIANCMFHSALEDYANVIAVHLCCGVLSTLLPPLCGSRENFGVPHKMIIHFTWQAICTAAILTLVTICTIVIFCIMKILKLLQNEDEGKNHQRIQVVLDNYPSRRCFKRLWRLRRESYLLQPKYRVNTIPHQQYLDAITKPGTHHQSTLYQSSSLQAFPMQEYSNSTEENERKDAATSMDEDLRIEGKTNYA